MICEYRKNKFENVQSKWSQRFECHMITVHSCDIPEYCFSNDYEMISRYIPQCLL